MARMRITVGGARLAKFDILSPSLYFAGKEAENLYGFRYLMNRYSILVRPLS